MDFQVKTEVVGKVSDFDEVLVDIKNEIYIDDSAYMSAEREFLTDNKDVEQEVDDLKKGSCVGSDVAASHQSELHSDILENSLDTKEDYVFETPVQEYKTIGPNNADIQDGNEPPPFEHVEVSSDYCFSDNGEGGTHSSKARDDCDATPSLHDPLAAGKKVFNCSFCTKSFYNSAFLKRHLLTHTGEKLFSCPICSKAFAQLCNMKIHILTHTATKSFTCSVCTMRFSQSSHLKHHMLLHTGERPYACKVCSETFTQSSTLNRHMSMHKPTSKTFPCPVCTKCFTQLSNMKAHMLIHDRKKS